MYVLLLPTSVGTSKFGAVTKESEVDESESLERTNFSLSSPLLMVIVADSLVVIVPTRVEFSGVLKVSADGNVGGVVSPSGPCMKVDPLLVPTESVPASP